MYVPNLLHVSDLPLVKSSHSHSPSTQPSPSARPRYCPRTGRACMQQLMCESSVITTARGTDASRRPNPDGPRVAGPQQWAGYLRQTIPYPRTRVSTQLPAVRSPLSTTPVQSSLESTLGLEVVLLVVCRSVQPGRVEEAGTGTCSHLGEHPPEDENLGLIQVLQSWKFS